MKELNIECIDYVLSGLPFTSLPKEVSVRILSNVMELIHDNGKFITFQYSLLKKGVIQRFFPEITLKKVWLNFPPAYVLSCKKEARRAYA
ncbi:hypothetical protein TUN_33030 [Bacillus sp. M21]|nr:hypothetical protein TUN_33030 [Bacillus sp. M21]